MCAAASAGGDRAGDEDLGPELLHASYQSLLRLLLADARAEGDATAVEKRWAAVLSDATWPEVLRRCLLTRSRAEEPYR